MFKFIKIPPFIVLALAIVGFIFYFNQPSPQAAPGAVINWTPANVTDVISPGGSKSVEVSFVATSDLNNVEMFVVPELQPYVEVSPSTFSHVGAGTVTPVTIKFSAPSNAELGTFYGTIHIKSTKKNRETFPKPLPIIVEVLSSSNIYMNEEFGYKVTLPHNVSFSKIRPEELWGDVRDSIILNLEGEGEILNHLTINVIEDSLEHYIEFLQDLLIVESREDRVYNGIDWTIIHFAAKSSGIKFVDAFAQSNGFVYQIGYLERSLSHQAAFEEMLPTFAFIQ